MNGAGALRLAASSRPGAPVTAPLSAVLARPVRGSHDQGLEIIGPFQDLGQFGDAIVDGVIANIAKW